MDQRERIVRRVGVVKERMGGVMSLAGHVIGMTFNTPTLLQSPCYSSVENKDG